MTNQRNSVIPYVSLALIIALVLSIAPAQVASFPFEDIVGHWAVERIQKWLDHDFAGGYPEGTFRPEAEVTRAEFVAFVNRAYDVPSSSADPGFEDVQEDDWYYRHVADAASAGLISGYPDGTFGPGDAITREEAAAIVNRLLDLEDAGVPEPFADQDQVSEWARGAVEAATAAGIVSGYPDNTFRPAHPLTRAEAVSILDRGLESGDVRPVPSNKVTFQVADRQTRPLEGAAVELEGTTANGEVQRLGAETDENGQAVFDHILPGDYDYTVSLEGYLTARGQLAVENRITREVTLEREPDAEVTDAANLEAALEDEAVKHLVLVADIEADVTVERPLTIDFAGHTLEGDIVFRHQEEDDSKLLEEGASRLLEADDPGYTAIAGDLTVDTPKASFVNEVKASGEITIDAVAPDSFTEHACGNTLVINAVNATITITCYGDAKVTETASGITISVADGVELEIDVDGDARDITVDAGEGSRVTLTGDGAGDVTKEGDGEVDVDPDPDPDPSPSPSPGPGPDPDPDEYTVTFAEGNGLEDVEIHVADEDTVTTGSGGEAQMELEDGEYDFTASKGGYQDYTAGFEVEGEDKTVEFEMMEEVTKKTVTFAEANELEGVEIEIDGGETVTTGEDGQAALELEDGEYDFTASKGGYQDYTAGFEVEGEDKMVEFELTKTGSIPVANREDLEAIGGGNTHTFARGTGYEVEAEGTMYSDYVMVNDVDLAGESFEPVGHGSGDDYTRFTGTFDGNGFKIHDGEINYPEDDYIGLFAYIGADAQMEELELENIAVTGKNRIGVLAGQNEGTIENSVSSGSGTVTGKGTDVGGLVGRNQEKGGVEGDITHSRSAVKVIGEGGNAGGLVGNNRGSISNSHSTGDVTGEGWDTGGLVGYNSGDIEDSYSKGKVVGDEINTGGLVGKNEDGATIQSSHSKSEVHGATYTGGLVGRNHGVVEESDSSGDVDGKSSTGGLVGQNDDEEGNYDGAISNSHSTGDVKGERRDTGGLVGWHGGTIENSYSTGNVQGSTNTGGLAGDISNGTIEDSYSTSEVHGGDNTGGLVGCNRNSAIIKNSYSTGAVTGDRDTGGLVGQNDGSTITNSYWNTTTSGQSDGVGEGDSSGVKGKKTIEMIQQTTFSGWDFEDTWQIGPGQTYPYLRENEQSPPPAPDR